MSRIIEKIAPLLVAAGVPAGQATLFALILIYLMVTGLIVGCLLVVLLRRRHDPLSKVTSSERES